MKEKIISILASIVFMFAFVVHMNPVVNNSCAIDKQTEDKVEVVYRNSGDSKNCAVQMSYFILIYNNGHIHIEVQCDENKITKPGLIGSIVFSLEDIAAFNESGNSGNSIFTGVNYYSRYNTKYTNNNVQYDLIYSDYVSDYAGLTLMNIDLYIKENPVNEVITIYILDDCCEIQTNLMNWIDNITTSNVDDITTTFEMGVDSIYLLGDANNDKSINMADAVLIMQLILNPDNSNYFSYRYNPVCCFNADVDHSGDITNKDALLIQQYKLRIITNF